MNTRRQVRRAWHRAAYVAVITLAPLLAVSSGAIAEEVCTSFEAADFGICPNEVVGSFPPGNFTIGTSPITATFTDGDVMVVGVGAYYRSGTHSWHVGPGVTGTISFETPASKVELFFRDTVGGGPSEVRVIDTDNLELLTIAGSQVFQRVTVEDLPMDQALIDRIEVENRSTTDDVVVDDVLFVPESSAQLLLLTGIGSVALLASLRSGFFDAPIRMVRRAGNSVRKEDGLRSGRSY